MLLEARPTDDARKNGCLQSPAAGTTLAAVGTRIEPGLGFVTMVKPFRPSARVDVEMRYELSGCSVSAQASSAARWEKVHG